MGCAGSTGAMPEECSHDFDNRFLVGRTLGQGAFGTVRAIRPRRPTGTAGDEELAVKIMRIHSNKELGHVQREYSIWKKLGAHPNVLRLEAFYVQQKSDARNGLLVMERCSDSLLSRLDALSDLALQRPTLQSMLAALDHVHGHGIVHRDVKLENFLLGQPFGDDPCSVKLCDFGVAAELPSWGYLTSVTGSAPYMAPEVAKGERYDFAVDLWSCGVCFFVMLYASFPYLPAHGETFLSAVANGEELMLPGLGVNSAALAHALLCRNAASRPTAKDALQMSYFTAGHKEPECKSATTSKDWSTIVPTDASRLSSWSNSTADF